MRHPLLALAAAALLVPRAAGQPPPPAFVNTVDTVPPGWTGPVFELSKDFPATLPTGDPKPWKAFDFKTQPEQYLGAILAYAREGNEAVEWAGQNNAVRKWFHAPGLVVGNNGREFVRGLTRERTSRPGELGPAQTQSWSNFAVGLYNPTAGFAIGRVWQTPTAPDLNGVTFEDGAVAIKLLFSTAPDAQVPFLAGSMEWQANVSLAGSNARAVRPVRLLQVDVAVRDTRADPTTGWVFGTFMYENTAPGAAALDKLVPVGLMWGNDPGLTPAKHAAGDRVQESWVNPASKSPHVGWLGRLNGPVDNPLSSCLSCHAKAGAPQTNALVFPATATDAQKMAFFTNLKAGDPPAPGVKSYDYSLQLGMGVRNFPPPPPPPPPPGPAFAPAKDSGPEVRVAAAEPPGFNPRAGEPDPHQPADGSGPDPARKGPAHAPEAAAPPGLPWWTWWAVGGGVGLVLVVVGLVARAGRANARPGA